MSDPTLAIDDATRERFWNKTRRAENGCLEWTGASRGGYGAFKLDGRVVDAHRMAWELTRGAIPEGAGYHGTCVCHRCDNRKCVDPSHLFLGSQRANVRDAVAKDRQRIPDRATFSKLTEGQVYEIRKLYDAGGYTYRDLGRQFRTAHTNIAKIVLRQLWRDIA